MPPGHNGPWRLPETPTRTTAHWAITFRAAYGLDGRQAYRSAALRAAEWVSRSRSAGGAFDCLRSRKKATNGLIGQAWAVEALADVGTRLARPDLLEVARSVVRLHPFDHDLALWRRLDLGGAPGGIERTANQQIWFAAVAAEIAGATGDVELASSSGRFLEQLPRHLVLAGLGPLVLHFVGTRRSDRLLLAVLRRLPRIVPRRDFVRLSRGYASFLLAGLAVLEQARAAPLPARVHTIAKACLTYLEDELFSAPLDPGDFAWAYNPTGIEAALAIESLGLPARITADQWLAEQWRRHLGPELMDRGTGDPAVLAARIYEAVRVLGARGSSR